MDAVPGRRCRRLLLPFLLATLVAGACGRTTGDTKPSSESEESVNRQDSQGAPDGSSEKGSQSARAGESAKGGQPVGQVVKVIESLARVGGQRIGGGDALYRDSELTTDTTGRATFTVGQVLEDCQVQTDSRLMVAPSPQTPLKVDQGSVICRSKPGTNEFEVPAGRAVAAFLDPIFLIDVSGDRTKVRVDYGFLQIRKAGGGSKSLLVGPGAELTVGSGPLPGRAESFNPASLDQSNAQALARMRGALPPDPRGFPNTGNSEALRRIRAAGTLKTGFDDSASRASAQFGRGLFGVLSGYWQVGSDVGPMDHADASWSLQHGVVDVFISPEPVAGAAGISLFGDEDGRKWSLWVRPDDELEAAVEGLLKTILNNGDYGKAYLAAFGQVPLYEVVSALAYPKSQQAGVSQWNEPAGRPAAPPAAKVRSVALSSSESNYEGTCPVDVKFVGQIVVEEPGTVDYEFILNRMWYQNEFSAAPELHAKGSLLATEPGTLKVETTLRAEEGQEGWMNLGIPAQELQSPKAPYSVSCGFLGAMGPSFTGIAG